MEPPQENDKVYFHAPSRLSVAFSALLVLFFQGVGSPFGEASMSFDSGAEFGGVDRRNDAAVVAKYMHARMADLECSADVAQSEQFAIRQLGQLVESETLPLNFRLGCLKAIRAYRRDQDQLFTKLQELATVEKLFVSQRGGEKTSLRDSHAPADVLSILSACGIGTSLPQPSPEDVYELGPQQTLEAGADVIDLPRSNGKGYHGNGHHNGHKRPDKGHGRGEGECTP